MARKKCPIIKEECWEHGCEHWIHIIGKHPQSGAQQDHFDCAFKWIPILMIENSQQQRQTGAAIESFRNEMTRQSDEFNNQGLARLERK